MRTQELYELVASALKVRRDEITPDSGLNHHPAWDSLAHVAVVLALEKHLGIVLDDDSVERFTTMAEILRLAEPDADAETH